MVSHVAFLVVCILSLVSSVDALQAGCIFNGPPDGSWTVSLGGDVNNDNKTDILIGAYRGQNQQQGQAYLIYGSDSHPTNINVLSYLGVTGRGCIINGISDNDRFGYAVSIGRDVNGDNIDDILVSGYQADIEIPYNISDAGQVAVIFGNQTFRQVINLNTLAYPTGFMIDGILVEANLNSVSLGGDVNGDEIGDILIGSQDYFPKAGQSYVIFGRNISTPFPKIDLNEIDYGFKLNASSTYNNFGSSVSLGGDVNSDGLDDILITAHGIGQSYVIFGRNTPFPAVINMTSLDGIIGFSINGSGGSDSSSSLGGDVNGDNIDDILIGAPHSNSHDKINNGNIYVIFGNKGGFPPIFELNSLDGSNGFMVYGKEINDTLGLSVSIGGDVNGDNIDDILIGAGGVDSIDRFNITNSDSGECYVIFGTKSPFPPQFDITTLSGVNGFSIHGVAVNGTLGYSVSLGGDVNGDGVDDILLGSNNGQSYLIYGRAIPQGLPSIVYLDILQLIQIQISLQNFLVETNQKFFVNIPHFWFEQDLGININYNTTLNTGVQFSLINSSLSRFDGSYDTPGNYVLSLEGSNVNGIVAVKIFVVVVPKQREYYVPDNDTLSFQVPDPSGGGYHYEAGVSSGGYLPPFIHFNSSTNVLFSDGNVTIVPQIVQVTVVGYDDNGQEQVRYDYSIIFGAKSASSENSEDSVNIGAIVGGTLGGIALITIVVIGVIVALFFFRKHGNSEF